MVVPDSPGNILKALPTIDTSATANYWLLVQ